MLDVLDPKKDAAAADAVVDHAEDDLKSLADHFVQALAQLCETHTVTINIIKKEV